MSWFIKQKKDKWEIHSTVTDSMIASFDTKKECARFIAMEEVYKGKKKAIEELMCFPSGWTVNGNRCFENNNYEEYYNWLKSILNCDTYEEYYKRIDDKLEELLNEGR